MYPSMHRSSKSVVLSQTGQTHVGLRSFICRNRFASKHCKCLHVVARQGRVILHLPNGQAIVTLRDVMAIMQSPSSLEVSSLTGNLKVAIKYHIIDTFKIKGNVAFT